MAEFWTDDGSAEKAASFLLRLVADSIPALMAYYETPALRCRFANQRYAEYNGWTPQTVLGRTVREIIGEAAWQQIEPHVQIVVSGKTVNYVRDQTLPSGERRVIEVNLLPHVVESGEQMGAFVLINDITDQWQAEQAIRDSETRMRKFAEATEEGILFHRDGVITDVNEALLRLSGYAAQELLGRQTIDFIPEVWKQTVIDNPRASGEEPYEAGILHKEGRVIPVELVGKTMPFGGETYRLVVVRDITARKQAQQRIEFLAWHDALTQLPNRLYLADYLTRKLAACRRQQKSVAILFVDLDGFKGINDTFGHEAGDELLSAVALRLKSSVRESDLVARLGGDEFLIVLNDIHGPPDVERAADAVLAAMRLPFFTRGQAVAVTPSIGVSVFPTHGDTADELIRHADSAMYRAKTTGGNHFRLHGPM